MGCNWRNIRLYWQRRWRILPDKFILNERGWDTKVVIDNVLYVHVYKYLRIDARPIMMIFNVFASSPMRLLILAVWSCFGQHSWWETESGVARNSLVNIEVNQARQVILNRITVMLHMYTYVTGKL